MGNAPQPLPTAHNNLYAWNVPQEAYGLAISVRTSGLQVELMVRRGATTSAIANAHRHLDELERLIPQLRDALPPKPEDTAQ